MFGRRNGGERAAYEAELAPHLDTLYGAALRLTRNPRDAEDLVQEAALRGFRFYHQYEPGTRFKAWVLKILTNTFINQYRQRARESKVFAPVDIDSAPDRVPSTELMQVWSNPEQALERQGLSEEVERALERLPVDFRVAVVLADLQDLSYREIAEALDCPIGTVMSRLYRGRQMLQRSLYCYAVRQGILPEAATEDGRPASLEDFRRRRKEARRRSS